MEYAKKMILVPEHLVSRHILPDEKLSELDLEMKQILFSQMDDDTKIKMYNQVLQKRIKINSFNSPIINQEPQSEDVADVKPEIKEEEMDIETITLSTAPKRLSLIVKNVFELLKRNSDVVSWTPHGELIHRGEVVKHSNIVDLINSMMRKKKSDDFLPGQEEFSEILRDINVPQIFIKNDSYIPQKGSSIVPKIPYQWLKM